MDILWDIIIYFGVHLKCNEDRDEGRNNGSINNSVKGHITGVTLDWPHAHTHIRKMDRYIEGW